MTQNLCSSQNVLIPLLQNEQKKKRENEPEGTDSEQLECTALKAHLDL